MKEYVLKKIIQWCQNHTRNLSLRNKDSSNKESNDTEINSWAHELIQVDINTLFEILVVSVKKSSISNSQITILSIGVQLFRNRRFASYRL